MKDLICLQCGLKLQSEKIFLSYLGHNLISELLSCPQCRQVFIPEDLARGKIAETERELEDK